MAFSIPLRGESFARRATDREQITGGEATPTMECDLDTTIPDWIIEHPQVQAVFDELGLDTSCGGKSLRYVCHQQGLSPQAVLERLQQVIAGA